MRKANIISEISQKARNRFWKRVDVKNSNEECWLWSGAKSKNGYGQLVINGTTRVLAHRVSYFLKNGEPGNLMVCHTCDNPSCVNPSHLFLGTHTDNVHDMMKKGRGNKPCGEKIGSAVLKPNQVLEIRGLHETGQYGQTEIGRMFGVRQQVVWAIINRKTWNHL